MARNSDAKKPVQKHSRRGRVPIVMMMLKAILATIQQNKVSPIHMQYGMWYVTSIFCRHLITTIIRSLKKKFIIGISPEKNWS
jgi:hypothetical protein